MSRVAIVRNPISTGNMRSAPLRPQGAANDVLPIEATTLDELWHGLHEARDAGVGLVLVDGGDGTVREVLSRLPEIWGPPLPAVGILPRGNTNLIARGVGGLRQPDAVDRVLHRLRSELPLNRRAHPVLRIDYPAGEHARLRGFMMGWGAYATGTLLARDEIAARGPGQIALTIVSVLRRAVLGTERHAIRRGVAASLGIDGAPGAAHPRLLGLATTLRGPLVAGLDPFWGSGEGPIRWLDVAAPGRRLLLAAPFLARGRPRRWMAGAGYASGRADRIELALETSFVLDGEIFPPAQAGPLILSAGELVEFVTL